MHFVKIAGNPFLWLLFFLIISSCQPKSAESPASTPDSLAIDSTQSNALLDSTVLPQEQDYSNCVRGHAEPVVKNTVDPRAVFELNKDGHTGTESIEFGNGDKLVIKNWGCEYYILTFRFETARFAADTTDTPYWMDKIVTLMSGIQSGLDAPLNISSGTDAVKNLLNGEPKYSLGEEIVYNNDEIREYVTIDRIQKINDNRFAVEVSYLMGPL
ncbi:MAG: hypothetical protein ABJA70_03215 [Chryseolinea sp.]